MTWSRLAEAVKRMIDREEASRHETDIETLKEQARRHYVAYRRIADNATGGEALLQEISITAREHALAFDAAMKRICALDPGAPPFIPLSRSKTCL